MYIFRKGGGFMKQTLKDFVLEWNELHDRFVFSFQEAPGTSRPTEVGIRYSAAKYQDFFSTDKWNRLKDIVEAKSHGTMYVFTDEYLFERGIIDIKIASSNHNYQERLVTGVLRWIGEEFFMNVNKKNWRFLRLVELASHFYVIIIIVIIQLEVFYV